MKPKKKSKGPAYKNGISREAGVRLSYLSRLVTEGKRPSARQWESNARHGRELLKSLHKGNPARLAKHFKPILEDYHDKEYKSAREVLRALGQEIKNLQLALDRNPAGNLSRAYNFCFVNNRFITNPPLPPLRRLRL